MHWDGDGGWWLVMILGMVAVWGLVALGVVWVVRELGGSRRRESEREEPDALAILDRRLAEGSIAPDEYRERRAVLKGARSEPGAQSG